MQGHGTVSFYANSGFAVNFKIFLCSDVEVCDCFHSGTFFTFDLYVAASVHVDVAISMHIDIPIGAYVHTVGGKNIQGALLTHFNPGLPIGMTDIKTVAIVAHGYLMAFGSADAAGLSPDGPQGGVPASPLFGQIVSPTDGVEAVMRPAYRPPSTLIAGAEGNVLTGRVLVERLIESTAVTFSFP